jgi:hypothetical protein
MATEGISAARRRQEQLINERDARALGQRWAAWDVAYASLFSHPTRPGHPASCCRSTVVSRCDGADARRSQRPGGAALRRRKAAAAKQVPALELVAHDLVRLGVHPSGDPCGPQASDVRDVSGAIRGPADHQRDSGDDAEEDQHHRRMTLAG